MEHVCATTTTTQRQHQLQQDQQQQQHENQQQFCLRWHNHQNSLLSTLPALLDQSHLTDVTISVDGRTLRAHRVVLSACSSFFFELFRSLDQINHPVIIIPGASFSAILALLTFMYSGEVNVYEDQIPLLLNLAETLGIKGLADVQHNLQKQPSKSDADVHEQCTKEEVETTRISPPTPTTPTTPISCSTPQQSAQVTSPLTPTTQALPQAKLPTPLESFFLKSLQFYPSLLPQPLNFSQAALNKTTELLAKYQQHCSLYQTALGMHTARDTLLPNFGANDEFFKTMHDEANGGKRLCTAERKHQAATQYLQHQQQQYYQHLQQQHQQQQQYQNQYTHQQQQKDLKRIDKIVETLRCTSNNSSSNSSNNNNSKIGGVDSNHLNATTQAQQQSYLQPHLPQLNANMSTSSYPATMSPPHLSTKLATFAAGQRQNQNQPSEQRHQHQHHQQQQPQQFPFNTFTIPEDYGKLQQHINQYGACSSSSVSNQVANAALHDTTASNNNTNKLEQNLLSLSGTPTPNSPQEKPTPNSKLYATCFICHKQLSNQYNLRVHLETHQNVRYACNVCSHVSRSKDALRKHISYRHPGAASPCDSESRRKRAAKSFPVNASSVMNFPTTTETTSAATTSTMTTATKNIITATTLATALLSPASAPVPAPDPTSETSTSAITEARAITPTTTTTSSNTSTSDATETTTMLTQAAAATATTTITTS